MKTTVAQSIRPDNPVHPMVSARPVAAKPVQRRAGVRARSAQATRDSILRAATKVFARHGYDGGSIEKISSAAKSVDRMIYYYFGSKQGLFVEVIAAAYQRMNDAESRLDLDNARPVPSLKAVIRFVLAYYRANPDFVTLLNTENLHKGRHIARSPQVREYSSPAIAVIERLLAAGAERGQFRKGLVARDVYLLIVASGYFVMSNRHTLSSFLGEDLAAPAFAAHWEAFVIDSVLRAVAA